MPLRITCSDCGKKLNVRDELAGKKVKCPGCGTVFVAAAEEAATGVKATPPRSAPPSAKDKVSAKPMAKRPAPPPMDDDDDLDERPVRGKKPIARDDDDEEDSDDRPSRGKGKRGKKAAGSKLWLWLVLAGVLLIGGAAGAYFIFFTGPANTGPIAKGKGPQGNPADKGAEQKGAEGANPVGGASGSLADLVPGDAMVFASLSGEVWNAQAIQPLRQLFGKTVEDEVQKNVGVALADVERVSVFTVASLADMMQPQKQPGNPGAPVVILVQTTKPLDQAQVTAAIKSNNVDKGAAVEFIDAKTMVLSSPVFLQMYKGKRGQTKASGVLERALAKASSSKGAVIAVNIPPEAAQMAGPAAQGVPPALLKARAVLATLDLTDKLQLQASLILDDAATAMQLKKDADDFLGGAPFLIDTFVKEPLAAKGIKQMLADLKISVQDKELTVAFEADGAIIAAMLLPAIQKVREAAVRTQDANNLKQLALGWINHADTNRGLMGPAAICDKKGKPLLSWRVAILPYIGQDKLFRQFKLDESWDSEHNRKLIPQMPDIYMMPAAPPKPGETHYRVFVGGGAAFNLAQPTRFPAGFPDGTSNTFLIVQTADSVTWTKPEDIDFDPQKPLPKLGGFLSGALFNAAFADASVRTLRADLPEATLRALITRAGGEVIPNLDAPPGFNPKGPGFLKK